MIIQMSEKIILKIVLQIGKLQIKNVLDFNESKMVQCFMNLTFRHCLIRIAYKPTCVKNLKLITK